MVVSVGSDCRHVAVTGASVYETANGIYKRTSTTEHGRPQWASGNAVLSWSDEAEGNAYFGPGTGSLWGLVLDGKHRYLAKGSAHQSPPHHGWAVRGGHKPDPIDVKCVDMGQACPYLQVSGAGSHEVNGLYARPDKAPGYWTCKAFCTYGEAVLRPDKAADANSWFGAGTGDTAAVRG